MSLDLLTSYTNQQIDMKAKLLTPAPINKVNFFHYWKDKWKNAKTKQCCKTLQGLNVDTAVFDITKWVEGKQKSSAGKIHGDGAWECDVSVAHGGWKRSPRGKAAFKICNYQKKRGKNHVCIDAGYISNGLSKDGRIKNYWSVGFNGLNGRADFKNSNSNDKRVKEMGIIMRPWCPIKTGSVLFCLQLPWDAAVTPYGSKIFKYGEWVEKTTEHILKSTSRNVILRVHPLFSNLKKHSYSAWEKTPREFFDALNRIEEKASGPFRPWGGRVEIQRKPKHDFIKQVVNSWCVVTYNSNSSVEATIKGIPSFVYDEGSMTWDISRHDYDIENPIMPDRRQWLNDISYAQWSPEEVVNGDAFRHLGILPK